ncbi:MAG: carbohydrate binding domain-containing protein, partial [Maribacter sp.]
MKNRKLIIYVASALMLFSCDDTIMEWESVDEDDQITEAELPLGLEEKISRYAPLKTYTDFVLGCGIIMDLYVNDEEYRNLVNENYDDVTVGYAMKHGAMVNSQGEINFEPVDNFIALTNEAGVDVYGHTLVWHANQNASYLNGLIASTVIPGSSGSSALNISGLQDGTLAGWGAFNAGDGISIVENNGLSGNSQAVQLISGAASAQPFELQLITPDIPVVMGNNYEVSFYIRSDQPGQGRISFSGLENNYPYQDWYNTGGEFTESFETNSQWQQVKFTVNDFTDNTFGMAFDLGYLPGVTYYIDVDNLSVVDLDAEPSFVNLITNGDFENGTLDGWNGYGNGSTREVSAEGSGFGDTGYAMVLTNPTEAQSFEAQQLFTFEQPLDSGTDYTCSFWVKASSPSTLQFELQSEDFSGDYFGGIAVGTDWMQVTQMVTPSTDDRIRFIFDFGESATTYTIDDIVFTSGEVSGGSEPVIIEKTDE